MWLAKLFSVLISADPQFRTALPLSSPPHTLPQEGGDLKPEFTSSAFELLNLCPFGWVTFQTSTRQGLCHKGVRPNDQSEMELGFVKWRFKLLYWRLLAAWLRGKKRGRVMLIRFSSRTCVQGCCSFFSSWYRQSNKSNLMKKWFAVM